MRKLLASIASLMLVLTLLSGVQSSAAYAAETGGCSTVVEGTPPGHSAGDADEVPGDADKATPHHHNLNHSHELAVPVREFAAVMFHASASLLRRAVDAPPAGFAQYRDLRPPIA